MHNRTNWCILYTKPKWERKVAEAIGRLHLNCYCPVVRTARQSGEWKRVTEEPVFPSFVFVACGQEEAAGLRQVEGVLGPVFWLKEPAIVSGGDIEAMQEFLSTHRSIKVERSEVAIGMEAAETVHTGPRGITEARLTLPSIGFTLAARVERAGVTVLQPQAAETSLLAVQ